MGSECVVGVDGSDHGLAAVEWAAREAASRGLGVVLVRALSLPFLDARGGERGEEVESRAWEAGTEDLAQAEEHVRAVAPDVRGRRVMEQANPVQLLFGASEDAAMIVVGERGRTSLGGVLAGSVAVQVATHATVPVVVVRGEPTSGGDVVVGVDDSPTSNAAIGYAFDVAARRDAPLVAVRAWSHPLSTGWADMLPLVVQGHQEAEDRMVAEALAGWSDRYPDVRVTRRVARGHPVHELEEASAGAQLVVVGSRGRGGFTGLLLGSVSMAMLHRAHCPVAVVRPAPSRDEEVAGEPA